MSEIQRIGVTRCGEAWQELQPETEGEWMRFEVHDAQLQKILAITNTPEWFDTPCARAIRAALEGKKPELPSNYAALSGE